jgi:hypothetical protein
MPRVAPYDRRFLQVFLAQLEDRAWPRFPTPAWWVALRVAERESEYVRPLSGYGPLMSQKVQLKGDVRPRVNFDWRTQAMVSAACDRWWRRYGPP